MYERLEDMLHRNGVRVISWASGSVKELPDRFLCGELVARADPIGPGTEAD